MAPLSATILEKTLGEVCTFFDEIANGTANYRTIHNLTQQIEHQYDSRFVIELLQNAHDMLGKDGDSQRRVELLVDRRSGRHGALYVANDGRPFHEENFIALARLGQSSKDPNDSVGNKGIGFRSVLEVSSAPEIFSRGPRSRAAFDGYCFRFDPGILKRLRAPIEDLLNGNDKPTWRIGGLDRSLEGLKSEAIRRRFKGDPASLFTELELLSPYVLPIPKKPTDPGVLDYERRGFATVVRLPFLSEGAAEKAIKLIRDLDAEAVIFLSELRSLTLNDGEQTRVIRRDVKRKDKPRSEVVIADSSLEAPKRRYWIWRRVLGGDDDPEGRALMKEAAASLPGKWPQITRAELSVAVELSEAPPEGRFYIYLPTNIMTGTGAHMNAPFFGNMARTDIPLEKPLNKLFLERLADLVIEIVTGELQEGGVDEARGVVDLVAPRTDSSPKHVLSLLREHSLGDQKLLLTGAGWKVPGEARLLKPRPKAKVITPARLRSFATFPVIHADLSTRAGPIQRFVSEMDRTTDPRDAELAATIAEIAKDLVKTEGVSWERFWQEVEELLPNQRVTALRGHKVLLDADGELRASDGPEATKVFFPAAADGDDEARVDVRAVPPLLKSRIAFLSPNIPLRIKREGRATQARKYLDPLVKEFRVETIVESVLLPALPEGPVKLESKPADLCGEILSWAAALVGSARSDATLINLLARLRLPCVGGWFEARTTAYGPGWPKTLGDPLHALLTEVGTDDAKRDRARLLLPPEHPVWRDSLSSLRLRLERMGVADGLKPRRVETEWKGTFYMSRWHRHTLPTAPLSVSDEQWRDYVNDVIWGFIPAYSSMFRYLLTEVSRLAVLSDIESLSPAGRRALMAVLVGSITQWDESWKTSRIRKAEGLIHTSSVESFLHFTLRRLPWLWIEPADDAPYGAPPDKHWYVPAIREPGRRHHFDHLTPLPKSIVSLIASSKALDALKDLGMPHYDTETQTSSPHLLNTLAEALERGDVEPANRDVFLGQVRDAWALYYPPEDSDVMPSPLVVTLGGRSFEAITPTDEAPVYLPSNAARSTFTGPFASLPTVVIQPDHAERLRPMFEAAFGDGVELLDSLTLEAWRGDARWERSDDAERLQGSRLQWLVPFALAVAAFAGSNPWGTQTRSFQSGLVALRSAWIDKAEELSIRLVKEGETPIEGHRQSSFWDEDTDTILYDDSAQDWLESLAGPLQRLLERTDIETSLRFALSKLGDDAEPSDEEQVKALAALTISEEQLNEVKKLCVASLSWVVERLRPAVALLAPAFDRARMDAADSEEALQALLAPAIEGVRFATLLEAAHEAANDRAMGRRLFEELGEAADLDAWNEALARLGPPYKTLRNERLDAELKMHLRAAWKPLRALARHVARSLGGATYKIIAGELESLSAPPALGARHWSLPFSEMTKMASLHFESAGAPPDSLLALRSAAGVEDLVERLKALDPTIEPWVDPAEIHAKNRAACKEIVGKVRRAAIVWCARSKIRVSPWTNEMDDLLRPINQELDEGAGFLDVWTEAQVLGAAARLLPRDTAHEALFQAIEESEHGDALLQRLGLKEADLSGADAEIEKKRADEQRRARQMVVCGEQFDSDPTNLDKLPELLERKIPDAAVIKLDIDAPAALKQIEERRQAGGGRSGPGPRSSASRLPEEKRRVIGLAGEWYVYRALCKNFGDLVAPACWVSRASVHKFPDNAALASDDLGYDFRVQKGKRIFYVEVKATSGEEDAFELGSSEVRQAARLANKKTSVFCIYHVKKALSSAPEVNILPNPFDEASKKLFRFEDAGQRVHYRSI